MNRSGELHVMKEIAKKKPEKKFGFRRLSKVDMFYIIVSILTARFEIGPKVLLTHFTS